jgi:hypothetical protein
LYFKNSFFCKRNILYQTNHLIEDAKEDSVDKATNDGESEPATKKIKISEDKPIGYAPEEDLIKLRPQVINTDFCIAKRQKYMYYYYNLYYLIISIILYLLILF